jgi:hypothetical protein
VDWHSLPHLTFRLLDDVILWRCREIFGYGFAIISLYVSFSLRDVFLAWVASRNPNSVVFVK